MTIDHGTLTTMVHARWPLLELARAHHTNRRAEAMRFDDKPFLIPLYGWLPTMEDASFCKAPQTGISEALIQLALYSSGWLDRICAYVLPTYKVSERFVAERIDPLLLRTPAYAERLPGGMLGLDVRGGENLKRKRFGPRGSLLFLGSNTPSDFLEFSCDIGIVDEWDVCVESNVVGIADRVRESKHPQLLRVSNPRHPKGIEQLWKDGTQEKWLHRCTRCGHRQALVWEQHVVEVDAMGMWRPRDREREHDPGLGDLRPVCARCRRPWMREPAGGVWAGAYPSRPSRSFHISRLDVLPSSGNPQPLRAAYVQFRQAQGNPTLLSAFAMGVLGWVWQSAGSRITDDDLDRAAIEPPLDYEGGKQYADKSVVMGVDVGAILNVTISVVGEQGDKYRRQGRLVCTVPSFDDVIRLIDAFHVDVCVIDVAPETREAKRVRDHYRIGDGEGRCSVWLAQFSSTPRIGKDEIGMKLDYEEHVIKCDRTQLLDATMADLRAGTRTVPSDTNTVLGWRDQMKAPVRRLEGNRFVWDEGTEPDHFRFADAYERLALEVYARSGGIA